MESAYGLIILTPEMSIRMLQLLVNHKNKYKYGIDFLLRHLSNISIPGFLLTLKSCCNYVLLSYIGKFEITRYVNINSFAGFSRGSIWYW